MNQNTTADLKGDVYFVYDGECPLCTHAAQALRIRQAVGPLHLINAREQSNHPILAEVNAGGYDLDEGMVIKFGDRFYHGADALGVMALLGTGTGWFNRMNALLFRSKTMATLLYPSMRGVRNLLIRMKGIPKIRNLAGNKAPIFQSIFGTAWAEMPPVLHQHYANRPYTNDLVRVEGIMEVTASPLMRILAPLLKFTGLLVPYEGKQVPTIVCFRSEPDSSAFCFDREFHFPGHAPYHFRSRMIPAGGNEVIEHMSLGIGWRAAYTYANNKVTLTHKGYIWRLFGIQIPMPFHLLFGKGYAEEEVMGTNSFRMKMEIRHPWFGQVYAYSGNFEVKEVALAS